MAFYASILIGIVASCRFFARFKKNVIWILGAILGIYVGRLGSLITATKIRSMIKESSSIWQIIMVNNIFFTLLGLTIGVSIGFRYKKFLSRAGTALLGAYFLIRGISRYVGKFPEAF